MEGEFTNNIHTARGNAEHEKVDGIHHETHSDRRSETALPLWSERLGLIGKADLVEFIRTAHPTRWSSSTGANAAPSMTTSNSPPRRCVWKRCSAAP